MSEYIKPPFEKLQISKLIEDYELNDLHESFKSEYLKLKRLYSNYKSEEKITQADNYLVKLFKELHEFDENEVIPIETKEVQPIPEPVKEPEKVEKPQSEDEIAFEDLTERTKRGAGLITKQELLNLGIKYYKGAFVYAEFSVNLLNKTKFIFTKLKNDYKVTAKKL